MNVERGLIVVLGSDKPQEPETSPAGPFVVLVNSGRKPNSSGGIPNSASFAS